MKRFTKEQLEIINAVFWKEQPKEVLEKYNIHFLEVKELDNYLEILLNENNYEEFQSIFWFFTFELEIYNRVNFYKKYILNIKHYEHENMVSAFQSTFNNNTENISILLKALENIPEYLQPEDFKYPYIRKIIYSIGAQPQPESLLALEKLAQETKDKKIKELALHQLEKRKRLGRWEAEMNSSK